MSAVRVQYTVRPECTSTNQANIAAVMAELREPAHPGVRYAASELVSQPDAQPLELVGSSWERV